MNKQIHQSPRPVIKIHSPESNSASAPKLEFDISKRSLLKSYQFTQSVTESKGAFSLVFYPDDYSNVKDELIFDQIQILDIVEIFETGNLLERKSVFTGIIRKKQYSVQMTNAGPNRSVVVNGHSIAGLVQEFKLSFDVQAMAITNTIANSNAFETDLTTSLIQNNNEPLPVKTIITKVWEHFLKASKNYQELSNPKVAEYITNWMDADFFAIDDSKFHYPIGNVFTGKNIEEFYDVISGIAPKPIYELFPYTKDGRTKIVIRESPFDLSQSDSWKNLAKKTINPILLKSFDVNQSDDEVYTVFFSYVDGYPPDMNKSIIMSAQKLKGMPGVLVSEDKFGVYGYRPLYLSFKGYSKSDKEDTTTAQRMNTLNNRLREWYGNLDRMYSGTLILSTDITTDMPQAGEKIEFLGGEFYVLTAEHRWTYGGNPETVLSVSRGGDYSAGAFKELADVSKRYQEQGRSF